MIYHEPNYEDVDYLEAHGHWRNGEVPAWAEELALRWGCCTTHPWVLTAAMKHEIRKLRDVVGICHSAMVLHDQGTKVGENLYQVTCCPKCFSAELEIAARALDPTGVVWMVQKKPTEEVGVSRKCVRCGAELNVTEATDESGNKIEVPEYVICGKCLTPEEKEMYRERK